MANLTDCEYSKTNFFKKFTKQNGGHQQDEIRKLLFYTMYACGAPMLIIILSVVVEYQPSTYSGPRPEFGVHRCFFGNDLGSFVFFHLPLLVIQVRSKICCSEKKIQV